MNNTITLSHLITRLAKVADTDIGTARRFLRSFFAAVEEELVNGETVSIKGIGTFRCNTDESFNQNGPVVFIPDTALADEINAPFAMFEPVELAEDVDFSEVAEEKEPEPLTEPVPEAPQEPVAEPAEMQPEPSEPQPAKDVAEIQEETVEEEVPDEESPAETDTETIELGPAEEDEEPEITQEDEEPEAEPSEPGHGNRKLWLWIALGLIAGAAVGYFAAMYEPAEADVAEEDTILADTTAVTYRIEEVSVEDIVPAGDAVPEKPSDEAAKPVSEESTDVLPEKAEDKKPAASEPRYDTVSGTRYLATMAREYYGKGIYWVFIYQANADKLDNPNRIKPGTRVLIPEKSSFAEATDKETLRKAERIQAELNKKYR